MKKISIIHCLTSDVDNPYRWRYSFDFGIDFGSQLYAKKYNKLIKKQRLVIHCNTDCCRTVKFHAHAFEFSWQ